MKLSATSNLRLEDYPSEQRPWLGRLFTPLNKFLSGVAGILNGNVEFGSNIPAQDHDLVFTYSGVNQKFLWDNVKIPRLLLVGQAYESNAPIAVSIAWIFNFDSRQIEITGISVVGATETRALVTGRTYKLFLRVVA